MRSRTLLIFVAILAQRALAQSGSQGQNDVVSEALRVNPAIIAARQHVSEAQARVAELTGQRRLQLSLQGTLSESNGRVAEPPSVQTFGTAEASLVAPLPNLGRVDSQVDQARAQLAAVQSQLRHAELDVEFRASQAFIEYWRAQESQSIAEQNLAQATRQADDTQKRIDAGDVPAADLLKAQVPVAQDRAALARAKIAVSVARQNLNDILQRDLSAPIDLATPGTQAPVSVTAEQAVMFAYQHSPDVLEAEANTRAAEANVRVVRHGRDSEFSMQLTHSRTSDITAYSYVTMLALTVTFPIADGGVVSQQVRQAELQLAQAQTALKQTRQQSRLSVEQALLDVQGDEANAEATAATEVIAQQSLDKARQAYAAGLTTTRDVLDAQLVYSQARVEANAAQYDLAVARAHLKQLMGGSMP